MRARAHTHTHIHTHIFALGHTRMTSSGSPPSAGRAGRRAAAERERPSDDALRGAAEVAEQLVVEAERVHLAGHVAAREDVRARAEGAGEHALLGRGYERVLLG